MQTAISINSRYRRAARCAAPRIYKICEGQDGDQWEMVVGQRSHRWVLDQVDKTAANDEHINFALCYSLRVYYVDMSSEGGSTTQSPLSFQWDLLTEHLGLLTARAFGEC